MDGRNKKNIQLRDARHQHDTATPTDPTESNTVHNMNPPTKSRQQNNQNPSDIRDMEHCRRKQSQHSSQ